MSYDVRVVPDDRLPADHDWMLLADGERACLFVRESRTADCRPGDCDSCPVIASADAAFTLIEQRSSS